MTDPFTRWIQSASGIESFENTVPDAKTFRVQHKCIRCGHPQIHLTKWINEFRARCGNCGAPVNPRPGEDPPPPAATQPKSSS